MQLQFPLFAADDQVDSEKNISYSELCPALATFFSEQLSEIDRHLVRDLSFISQLAHYKEGMKVSEVTHLEDNKYQLHFDYTWHIFQGCMDMNETGEMKDKANFTLSDKGLIKVDLTTFQVHSTADEL